MTSTTNNNEENEYEEIQITLKLKKNIAEIGKLIAKYHYNDSFDKFVSEEVRQAILAIGPDYFLPSAKQDKEYADKLLENEEI